MDAVDFALRRMAAWLLSVCTTDTWIHADLRCFASKTTICIMQQPFNMPYCLGLCSS
jgi:hypothetical protein